MSMTFALWLTPWILVFAYVAVRVRMPRPLPPAQGPLPNRALPRVSVIVPARNEAHNIKRCLESLSASSYPDLEVLVVDDRSTDETAEAARTVPAREGTRTQVIAGRPLPDRWFGKPWACAQGASAASGSLLLFTDADTWHGPDLLERAVLGLEQDHADALTLFGRQEMDSFWERLVQPHFFALLLARYPNMRAVLGPSRWRDAIANGQFILVRDTAYRALDGHSAVAGEVAEDLRFAQELVRSGYRLSMRGAEHSFATRMYRSLGELVEGWSKNAYIGSRQAAPAWARPFLIPAGLLAAAFLWLLPPLVLVGAALGGLGPAGSAQVTTWAAATTAMSAVFWVGAAIRLGAPPAYGLIYPLGVGVTGYILARSWLRGSTVSWKGRTYRSDRATVE